MSIIIRLQNLPWAANSVDIRRYFSGLCIPEGGVHIVGGEKGDAFIAFSTDEDARQAMERDGGKIKDMKVKLLLSSRAEMTRVIEQARNQTLSLQTPAAIKAAANDSDRRKSRRSKSHSPSPTRNRKDRDKSPTRDRRKSYSKRDRSRSRSPSRRQDRDVDRRSDRSKRDDRPRYDDRGDTRYKNSRDYSSRENSRDSSSQDRKYDSNNKTQSEFAQNKSFDPRVGATPQPFDSRHLDGGSLRTGNMEFNPPQGNLPDGSASYFDSRNYAGQDSNASAPYHFPAAEGVVPLKPELKVGSLQAPPFPSLENFSSLFKNQQQNTPNFSGNYETKRPSPTPAALAPKVGSNSPFTKGYDMNSRVDPFNSMSSNFGNCPDPTASTFGTVQTAEKGATPAVPHDRKNMMSKPIYGAEPHARYEQIPEANQASKSSTAPLSASDSESYDKRSASSSNTASNRTQPRRSRFDQEIQIPVESPYAAVPTSSGLYSSRSTDSSIHSQQHSEISNPFRNNPPLRKDMPWLDQMPGPHDPFRPGLLKSPQVQEFSQIVPMDIDDNDDSNNIQPDRLIHSPHQRENIQARDNRQQQSRRYFPNNAECSKDVPFEGASLSKSVEQSPLNESKESPSRKRNDERSFSKNEDPRRDRSSLTVKVTNLPYDVNENDILQMFRGIFIGSENLKLQRNYRGEFSAFVKFLKPRDYDEALSRSRQRSIGGAFPEIIPCSSTEFDNAFLAKSESDMKKSSPLNQHQRSRDENFYVELQGLPGSCINSDVKKFFNGLEISNLILQKNPDGLCSGFVEFNTSANYQSALSTSGKMMGHNYITVTSCDKEKMDQIQKDGNSKKSLFSALPPKNLSPASKPDPNSDECIFCVVINNLPEFIKKKDIADFFSNSKIFPRNIHILFDNKKMTTEAFAEFTNIHDFEGALQQNGKSLSGSRLSINPITFNEMVSILKNPIPAPPLPSLIKNTDKPIKRPLIANPPIRQLNEVSDNFEPRHLRLESRYSSNEQPLHDQASQPYGRSRPQELTNPPLYNMDGPPANLELNESAQFSSDKPSRFDGPPRFRPEMSSRFGSDGPPPRFGSDGPPQFASDGPPAHFGPDGTNNSRCGPDGPPRFKPDGPPSRFRPDGPPSRFGPDGPPSRFGPDGPPSRFGNDGPPSRFGPDGQSRFAPDGPPRHGPEGPSRHGPEGPRHRPEGPPRHGQEGPPRHGQEGPPRHGQEGPPRHGQEGPPRHGQEGPPRHGQEGPPRHGPEGPPRHGSEGPPRFNSEGPPRYDHDGSSRHGHEGPPPPYDHDGSSRYGADGPSRYGPDGPSPRFRQDGPSRFRPDGPTSRFGPNGPPSRRGPDGPPSRRGPDGPPPHHASDGQNRYESDSHRSPYNSDGPPPRFGPDGPPNNFGPDGRAPPRFRGPSRPPVPKNDGPQDFGLPGCVVAIDNLHFNAGLDELLEVFHGFPLDKDKIIRKYNEKGQPTSEARIAFQCHEDAARAVSEVNKKPIFGRPIYLSLV